MKEYIDPAPSFDDEFSDGKDHGVPNPVNGHPVVVKPAPVVSVNPIAHSWSRVSY